MVSLNCHCTQSQNLHRSNQTKWKCISRDLPTSKIDSLLGGIGDSTALSKLGANSGYWLEKLAEKSQLPTTFLTPFGRYCFQRLPFGLKSAPERFQRRMLIKLEGLDGVICIMEDILVNGRTQAEHDKRLDGVLARLTKAKVTLKPDKCDFSKHQLKFAGHSLRAHGIGPDTDKTATIEKMERPRNVSELQRFLGMINPQPAKSYQTTFWVKILPSKPLVPLLGSRCLHDMPRCIQRFRMRLMRYSYRIVHFPGKDLCTADALSRTPLYQSLTNDDKQLNTELNL